MLERAARCRERKETVTAMLSLETIGCFTDEPDSQKYPAPLGAFYPSRGNFIAFDADNPGNWAFHCHHLYHMNAGMMGAVAYVNAA